MAFPRLIFENEIPEKVCSDEVITDLKLDLLFSEDVSRFLTLRPEKNNLLLRREAFSLLLEDAAASDVLTSLISLLEKARDLYRAMTAAQSEAASSYAFVFLLDTVSGFSRAASETGKYGRLFSRFADHFAAYRSASDFIAASDEASALCLELKEASSFNLRVTGDSAKVLAPAERTVTDALRDCATELMIPLKERQSVSFALTKTVADALTKVYPEVLGKAIAFTLKYRTLVSGEMFDYLPELKFLSGVLDFTREAEKSGIPYCFPELCEEKKIDLRGVYDVTLIRKDGSAIVPNDVSFTESEPFFYLTGANGGGKTTYLRAVGGAVIMFLAGAPVFCRSGEASLLSCVYTHFPRDERFEGTGRFLDEKKRVDGILKSHGGSSLILLNETFATTGEEKAIEQTAILAHTLYESGSFGLYITHQHALDESEIPFLGVTVDENDRNRRTYRIEKRRLPPRSFARDILEKYSLDKASLSKRFGSR